jgi:hypothetical protein
VPSKRDATDGQAIVVIDTIVALRPMNRSSTFLPLKPRAAIGANAQIQGDAGAAILFSGLATAVGAGLWFERSRKSGA